MEKTSSTSPFWSLEADSSEICIWTPVKKKTYVARSTIMTLVRTVRILMTYRLRIPLRSKSAQRLSFSAWWSAQRTQRWKGALQYYTSPQNGIAKTSGNNCGKRNSESPFERQTRHRIELKNCRVCWDKTMHKCSSLKFTILAALMSLVIQLVKLAVETVGKRVAKNVVGANHKKQPGFSSLNSKAFSLIPFELCITKKCGRLLAYICPGLKQRRIVSPTRSTKKVRRQMC